MRLVGRLDINGYATGALQVFHGREWGAVCSNTFENTDADVACRQMGFVGGTYLPLAVDQSQSRNTRRADLEVLPPLPVPCCWWRC